MHALEGLKAPDIGARDLRGSNGAALAGALQRARARGTGGGRAHWAAADMLRRAEERRRRRRADLSRRPSTTAGVRTFSSAGGAEHDGRERGERVGAGPSMS